MLKRIQVLLLLFLLITGLVLRKFGIPGSIFIFGASGFLLVLNDLKNGIRKLRRPAEDINTRSALTEFAFGISMSLVILTQLSLTGKHVVSTIAMFMMILVTFSFLEMY